MTVAALNGGTSDPERKRICQDFADGKIHAVLTTLAEGVNLQKADKVILLDLDWSYGKCCQREDRCHRIGQLASVTVMRVLAASIDMHKKDILYNKKEIVDVAIDGGESADAESTTMQEVIRRLTDD
jgi:SNF2 family DNA or RNA helicase